MQSPVFKPADILIPKDVPIFSWSTVACDQYSSEPEYWEKARNAASTQPSTYHMIYPECYLGVTNAEEYIDGINRTMRQYLDCGVFETLEDSYVYVERTLATGRLRRGIVGALDLDAYEYTPGNRAPVRATEGTVAERIPPRVLIRQNAPLELPHVMILIDDPEHTVIEPVTELIDELPLAYSGRLMLGGGSIRGHRLFGGMAKMVDLALDKLSSQKEMVFAVGDGNHSLASAKACYEQLKRKLPKEQWSTHPARYALVEIVNLYDNSLEFEPIHRIVQEVNPDHLLNELNRFYNLSPSPDGSEKLTYIIGGRESCVWVKNPPSPLTVGTLQKFLDDYKGKTPCRIDYIHGDEVVKKLSQKKNAVGFLLPPMDKKLLFPAVMADGVLPRKTFSMGHAEDKRYYLECRKIR